MMNSLSGEAVYIDLCAAKDKKLFVQINAQGQHPFQGKGIYLKKFRSTPTLRSAVA